MPRTQPCDQQVPAMGDGNEPGTPLVGSVHYEKLTAEGGLAPGHTGAQPRATTAMCLLQLCGFA